MSTQIDEQYYDNGKIRSRYYYFNNKLHRADGPAFEFFHPDGSTAHYIYYLDGERHRLDGPAVEWFTQSGQCVDTKYWLNGKPISRINHRRLVALHKLSKHVGHDQSISL